MAGELLQQGRGKAAPGFLIIYETKKILKE
jgi:hypothetical protein